MSIKHEFVAVLVNSPEDIIITLNPFCEDCFCSKMGLNIYKSWSINESDLKYYSNFKIRRVKINCVCKNKFVNENPSEDHKFKGKSEEVSGIPGGDSYVKKKSIPEIDKQVMHEINRDLEKDIFRTDMNLASRDS